MQRQRQPEAEVRAQIVSVANGGEEQVVLGRFNDRAEAQRVRAEVVDDAQQRYTRTTDHKRKGQAVGILQKDCRTHTAEQRCHGQHQTAEITATAPERRNNIAGQQHRDERGRRVQRCGSPLLFPACGHHFFRCNHR